MVAVYIRVFDEKTNLRARAIYIFCAVLYFVVLYTSSQHCRRMDGRWSVSQRESELSAYLRNYALISDSISILFLRLSCPRYFSLSFVLAFLFFPIISLFELSFIQFTHMIYLLSFSFCPSLSQSVSQLRL